MWEVVAGVVGIISILFLIGAALGSRDRVSYPELEPKDKSYEELIGEREGEEEI